MKQLGWLLFILFIGYFIFLIRQDIIDNLEFKRGVVGAEKGIGREVVLTGKLQGKLKQLSADGYLEQLARTRLGMVKKGETAYKVIND